VGRIGAWVKWRVARECLSFEAYAWLGEIRKCEGVLKKGGMSFLSERK